MAEKAKTKNAKEEAFPTYDWAKLWLFEGNWYDLSDFVKKHPGGVAFLSGNVGRDITTMVHAMHPRKERVKRVLEPRYVRPCTLQDMKQFGFDVPEFLKRKEMEDPKNHPKWDFDSKKSLLPKVHALVSKPEFRQREKRMDLLFNIVVLGFLVAYIAVQFLFLKYADGGESLSLGDLGPYGGGSSSNSPYFWMETLFLVSIILIRLALTGAGHYYVHSPKRFPYTFAMYLFDLTYVPFTVVAWDGHIGHHAMTQSAGDPKKGFMSPITQIPRLYRIPIFTLQKLAQLISGGTIRGTEISFHFYYHKGTSKNLLQALVGLASFLFFRVLLLGELILFYQCGHGTMWLVQFTVSMWLSLLMVLAGHDFDERTSRPDCTSHMDWVTFNVKNCVDHHVTGNAWIDCFITAGLGSHVIHHVLPYQRSPFSNIASQAAVQELCERESGVKWSKSKNIFTETLPDLLVYYATVPAPKNVYLSIHDRHTSFREENFSFWAIKSCVLPILVGLIGMGSI